MLLMETGLIKLKFFQIKNNNKKIEHKVEVRQIFYKKKIFLKCKFI